MTKKKFKDFLDESIVDKPEWGTYIHFCRVLGESQSSRSEITKLFNKYMPEDEYDKPEKVELIDYLYKIANEIPK
jgi:hypothetical protein